jgi:hypothetical protein
MDEHWQRIGETHITASAFFCPVAVRSDKLQTAHALQQNPNPRQTVSRDVDRPGQMPESVWSSALDGYGLCS